MINILLENDIKNQQKKFVSKIIEIRNHYLIKGISLDEMIISPAFWNFIADSSYFFSKSLQKQDSEESILVGHMMSMMVFVNLTIVRDKIILLPSLQSRREEKIDNLLNDDDKKTIIEIKIISDII